MADREKGAKNRQRSAGKAPSKAGEAAKTVAGLLLIPVVIAVSLTFYREFGSIDAPWSVNQQYFVMGLITYCFIHLLIFKPSYIYVFGHESVHALAAWLCFGKVKSFRVSSSGGSVSTSKNNIFISLSPYFVPFYSILLAAVVYIANNLFLGKAVPYKYFLFFLGLTLSLHVVMTIDTLKTRQPDLVRAGYLTSAVIVYVMNVVIISAVMGFMAKSFSFAGFMSNAWGMTIEIYRRLFTQLFLQR